MSGKIMTLRFTWVCICFCLCSIMACNQPAKQPEPVPGTPATDSTSMQPASGKKTIVFFGNSLTAGYGLDLTEAFPALIQKKIDSLGYDYKTVNAGLSGETTAGGKSRVDWILQQPVSIFVLELGGNDGLRGIQLTDTESNLQAIIEKVKTKYPEVKILLTGMQVPPNLGSKYAGDFKALYKRLAEKNRLSFLPFLLEGVGGDEKLNQADGIHPTAEGQNIVANNVWGVLKGLL